MAKVNLKDDSSPKKSSRPSLTPEAKEKRCIALAYALVEKRLEEGTASSQETVHFLKMGTEKARLENRLLSAQAEMALAKRDNLQSQKRAEERFEEAMAAFRRYSGQDDTDER